VIEKEVTDDRIVREEIEEENRDSPLKQRVLKLSPKIIK